MQNKLEGSFNLFPGMHIRSVTKCTTRLHDYEPMYIIVSPENLDRGPLAAESRRITPNQSNSHLWSFTYKVIHWLNTRWAGEPGGRFKTTSFLPTRWFTSLATCWAGELSRRSKTKSYRLQNDPLVWHTTGLESSVGCLKPHHFIHYLPITQTKPYHIMMTSNTQYYIISSSNYTVG